MAEPVTKVEAEEKETSSIWSWFTGTKSQPKSKPEDAPAAVAKTAGEAGSDLEGRVRMCRTEVRLIKLISM